ncbi:hypothetical protein M758_7G032300 [Ceratodon purpureus]|nr:hypothetical protein M758_7G032300 [Ceratodon purpureus]
MASSNPMTTTRILHRQTPQRDNIMPEGYRIRPSRDALSEAEVSRLKALEDDDAVPKSIIRLDIATLFRGLRDQLEVWPLFFRSKEECGTDMQQGLVTLWSNFMIAETLLASISIQPLVTVPAEVHGWRLKLYGLIWMISVVSDFWGIAITALFLGFLLGCPCTTSWYWMCEIGWMRSIPSILVLLDTFMSLAAIAYTCWAVYGFQIGIVSIVVEVFAVITACKVATMLIKAGEKIKDLR